MEADRVFLYAIASLLLFLAHVVRAARWALLFPPKEIYRRFDLLLGLALGYALNAVLPWRMGELVRAWFASAKTSVRFSFVASTVVAERLTDLIVVSCIALYVLFDLGDSVWPFPVVSIALAAFVILVSFQVRTSEKIRRFIWTAASLFNDKLRLGIVDFFWSLSELVTGGSLVRPRFLVTTLGMWLVYIVSYLAFARAAGQGLPDVIFAMLGSPLRPATEQLMTGDRAAALGLLLFTGFPVLAVILYGGLKSLPVALKLLNARRRYGWHASSAFMRNARNRFRGEGEYDVFLTSLFSGENRATINFGLNAIDDGTVHKLFVGGSDAITALVEVNQQLLIRKFAYGAAGGKLKAQHDWLQSYRCPTIPFVDIFKEHQKTESYHYDMPLVVPSSDFYDFIHTQPLDGTKRIFSEVIGRIVAFHEQHAKASADQALVRKYVVEKGVDNARRVLDFARTIFARESFKINGRLFSFKAWEHLLDPEWLLSQIRNRTTTVVHGDLTIENIIVAPQQDPDWYLIDPNPENIFNTPLIDWSKLMQSVNLGYEGLNRNFDCVIGNDSIQLGFTKSHAYTQLHAQLEASTREHLGDDGLREVYLHELINYLRLTPYKIRQNPKKAVCFFACTNVLLDRYLERAI